MSTVTAPAQRTLYESLSGLLNACERYGMDLKEMEQRITLAEQQALTDLAQLTGSPLLTVLIRATRARWRKSFGAVGACCNGNPSTEWRRFLMDSKDIEHELAGSPLENFNRYGETWEQCPEDEALEVDALYPFQPEPW